MARQHGGVEEALIKMLKALGDILFLSHPYALASAREVEGHS